MDYFEIDRVIEELPKSFAAPSATTWFKVSGQMRPSIKEYRDKVIEIMNNFKSSCVQFLSRKTRQCKFKWQLL